VTRTNSQFDPGRAASEWSGSMPRWPIASIPHRGMAAGSAVRLRRDRQRLHADVRTDASAPRWTGLKGRHDIRRRCLNIAPKAEEALYSGQVAQGSTKYPNQPMPIILSATVHNHRHACQICLWAAAAGETSSLHPAIAKPPVQPNPLYPQGATVSPGSPAWTKMTGAAIQDRRPRER